MADTDSTNSETSDNEATSKKEEAPKKGGLRGRIIKMVVLAFLVVVALTGGLTAAIGFDGVLGLFSSDAEEIHEKAEDPTYGKDEGFHFMNFDEIIVNIDGYTSSGRKTSRFMKIKLTMAYEAGVEEEIKKKKPFIREAFQDYLRQVNEREVEGSYGILSMKRELLKRAKAVSGNSAPSEILIGELIIQ
jgi:flagellar protein FliL